MNRICRFAPAAIPLLLALACGGGGKSKEIQTKVTLQSFASCLELQKYIADTAVFEMRSQLEQEKQGGGIRAMSDVHPPGASGSAAANPQAPQSYTQTNTQVPGVDEADFVKNDGTRIFVLSGSKLYLNRSWPPGDLRTVSKMEIEGWPREMFLDGENHLVVFSVINLSYPMQRTLTPGSPVCSGTGCVSGGGNSSKITVLDVSDLTRPVVQQEVYLPGLYNSARRIGSSIRIVQSNDFVWPPEVRWYPEGDLGLYHDRGRWQRALNDLMARNEEIIRRQPLEAWLPRAARKLPDGTLRDLEYSCSDFSRTNGPTRLGLITVATLNLAEGGGLSQRSLVAEPGRIYASPRALYIASSHWWWWPEPGQRDHTYVHKFDITQPAAAIYVASGGVDGTIADSFSIDEDAAGLLRVATTTAERGPDLASPWGRVSTANRVTVLGEVDGSLNVIGQTPEFSPDERIFGARFIGDRGFVVTYRRVDPFITLDLADPVHPKIVGELKVPGFSTYLHPIDDRHLLAIGQDVPTSGAPIGRIKISMFDVSDLAQPLEKYAQVVGTEFGTSEAEYEHKAFNYFPEKKLLAIPFAGWDPNRSCGLFWCGFTSDLRVFSVDPARGIFSQGALPMRDLYERIDSRHWGYAWSPWVRRSVMADDFAYAISNAGIRVAGLGSLATPIQTVVFDAVGP